MLWRKSWLECKIRLWICFFMSISICLAAMMSIPAQGSEVTLKGLGGLKGGSYPLIFILTSAIVAPVGAIILAGSGINTQTNWGMLQGFHPSMYFLLSLPVGRERLLRVRVLMGVALLCFWLLATMGLVVVAAYFGFAGISPSQTIRMFPNLLLGSIFFYSLAVFLSSFLDEYWSGMGSLTIAGFLAGYSLSGGPWPLNISVFMMRTGLWDLDVQAWAQGLGYVLLSVGLYGAAWKVVEQKEY